jgi:uncharacterized membrane protein
MTTWLAIGTVALFGGVEFWLAVPAGFAFGLDPLVICLATIGGGVLGVLAVLIPGERIGAWLARRREGKPRSKSSKRASRIWEKYGIIGLAFFSLILPGAPVGALIALALGAPKLKVFAWFSLSIIAWSVGVTLVGVLGLAAFGAH